MALKRADYEQGLRPIAQLDLSIGNVVGLSLSHFGSADDPMPTMFS
jgi:hypothetical protein